MGQHGKSVVEDIWERAIVQHNKARQRGRKDPVAKERSEAFQRARPRQDFVLWTELSSGPPPAAQAANPYSGHYSLACVPLISARNREQRAFLVGALQKQARQARPNSNQ